MDGKWAGLSDGLKTVVWVRVWRGRDHTSGWTEVPLTKAGTQEEHTHGLTQPLLPSFLLVDLPEDHLEVPALSPSPRLASRPQSG